ncbi:MAG: hypothetical protein KatS3mg105_2910 [Gemmatales bacterium]|nr:MAG: hypothetical protein KatS3mg105_2910 [Gemmatales bacterium]
MYSVVMMMALTGAAETPDGIFLRRGCSCYSCYSCSSCYCSGRRRIFGRRWCRGCYSCHGCWGCHGCHGCCSSCHGCHACYGCHGCCAAPAKSEPAKPKEKAGSTAPATIVVQLPADAKLYIGGDETRSTSSVRSFISPPIKRGKDYYYTLEGRLVRNGQVLSVKRDVVVRAGEESRVSLDFAQAIVAQR